MIFLRVDIVIFRVEVIFMFTRIREDIAAVRQRDPAARSGFEIVLMYAGVHALFWHRPAHRIFSRWPRQLIMNWCMLPMRTAPPGR